MTTCTVLTELVVVRTNVAPPNELAKTRNAESITRRKVETPRIAAIVVSWEAAVRVGVGTSGGVNVARNVRVAVTTFLAITVLRVRMVR